MTERLAFKSAGAVRAKPLWKMTDIELVAIAHGNDDRSDAAWEELEARARESLKSFPPVSIEE